MFSPDDILEETTMATFNKGSKLYKNKNIIEFEVYDEIDHDVMKGAVEEDNCEVYYQIITFDTDNFVIVDYSCTCTDFPEMDGCCKHIVAMALAYILDDGYYDEAFNEGEFFDEDDYYEDDYYEDHLVGQADKILNRDYDSKGPLKTARPINKKRQTDWFFKDLIEVDYTKALKPSIQNVKTGDITLEVRLVLENNTMHFAGKIGSSKLYVLKDWIEFLENMNKGNYHAYGKKLGFIHDLQMFQKEVHPLVTVMMELIEAFDSKQRNHYSQGVRKLLPVGGDQCAKVLECLKDKGIYIDGVKNHKIFKISHEPIRRKLTLKKVKDGLQVEPERLSMIPGHETNVFVKNNTLYPEKIESRREISDFLTAIDNSYDASIFVADEDISAFCRTLLMRLQNHYDLDRIEFDESDYLLEPASFSAYLDVPSKEVISCRVMVDYGEGPLNLFSDRGLEKRDLILENKMNKLVSGYFNAFDEKSMDLLLRDDEDKMYEFLSFGISDLNNYFEVFATDQLKNIRIKRKSKVAVGVSISEDLLALDIQSEGLSKEALYEILNSYNPKKKYYRMKNGDFIHVEAEGLEVLYDLKQGLNLSKVDLMQDQIQLPKFRALYIDEIFKNSQSVTTDKDKNFKTLISNMKTIEENDYELPGHLKEILRPYQNTGFLWMKSLSAHGLAGILADDMGLGKTLQVISFLDSELKKGDHKALIVCPSSLVYNWKSEFDKFSPALSVKMVLGSPSDRKALIDTMEAGDVLVTSYDLLKRDLFHYKDLKFSYHIIDEAQYIKNHNTQASKAVKSIQAGFKLALTGTPIENRLSELWSIFEYLMPGFLHSYGHFKKQLEGPIVIDQDPRATQQLQRLVGPFVLRRMKKDVLKDLPDKVEENMVVPLEENQQKIYDARGLKLKEKLNSKSKDEFNTSKIEILSELTKLRQICCDPKLIYDNYKGLSAKMAAAMELIHEAVDGGHKVLLFSQFTSVFPLLSDLLTKDGISYFTLTGETAKLKRMQMVETFNADDTSVFMISLKAGGTGLNLTSADIVIHFDPWWNIAVQNQATDRAHRIGQKNMVNVYKLIGKNTIEEKNRQITRKKKDLADQMLASDHIGVASFSQEDLLEVLGEY